MLLLANTPPYLAGAPQDNTTDYTPVAESLRMMPNSALLAARRDPRFPSTLVDAELQRRGATTPLSQYIVNPIGHAAVKSLSDFAGMPNRIAGAYLNYIGKPFARGLSYLTTPQLQDDQLPGDYGLDADGGAPDDDTDHSPVGPSITPEDYPPPDVADDSDTDTDFQTSPPPVPGAKPPYMPDLPTDTAAAGDDGAGPSITPEDYPPPGLTGSDAAPSGSNTTDLLRKFGTKLLSDEGNDDGDLALAKAGFAMMASRNPYFLGAVGEGGQAGISAFDAARRQRLDRQVRGASMLSAAEDRSDRAQDRKDTLAYRYAALKSAAEDRALSREDRAAAAKEANAMRLEIAKLTAASRETVAGTNADARTEAARIRAERAAAGVTEPLQKAMDTYDRVKDDPALGPIAWQRVMHVGGFKSPQDIEQFAQRMASSDLKAQLTPPADPDAWREQRLQYYRRMMNPSGKGASAPSPAPAAEKPAAPVPSGVPQRPSDVPAGAKFSPSQGKWWWQENGQWKSN